MVFRAGRPGLRAWLAALLLGGTLAACDTPQAVEIDHVWVRLPAVPGRPAVAYFKLHGGPIPQTLIGVSADAALRTELHASMAKGSVMTMAPLGRIEIPAKGEIAFAPGGRHAMLFGVNPAYKPGSKMVLTFTFAGGTRMTSNAPVLAAGDPAPGE